MQIRNIGKNDSIHAFEELHWIVGGIHIYFVQTAYNKNHLKEVNEVYPNNRRV